MPDFGLFRSVFGRVTLSALLVSLVSTLILFAIVDQIVRADARAMLGREVDTDLAGLADIYVSGGPAELTARIADRLSVERIDGERAFYLVTDGRGRRLAGNLTRWPDLSADVSEARFVTLPDGEPVFARATILGPDSRLVVGRSDRRGESLRRRLATAFASAGALVALVSLFAGHLAARRLRSRVEAVNATFAAVRDGRIEARVPEHGERDELGTLAGHSNAALDQIGRLIEAQRAVSDQTAHEIRTPLMHLDTRILRALECTADPALAAMLGQSREEIRGVVRLLDSLLDIAGTEAMRGDMRGLEEIDLSDLADALADLYTASAEDMGIGFRAMIAPGVTMRGDPMQMSRLMSNLLDNAFRHAPPGGTVVFTIAPGPQIMVEDNGKGIAPEDRERIFERYTRINPQQGVGHGLGLALAKAIAERHALHIEVSDAAPGARFRVLGEETT
ncbi:signal transduction histidine kinase [Sphingobium fontiphilum]|uniref:histidine kinase n=1 Tax=Sphingobium fontiphilum TaxID=944425 RepID=A0A7W6GNC7_9SPHN|nr:signal transduction histidine kinase [Sphingobium fontiphilum]